MRRREFIFLAAAASAWSLTARAQKATPVIGFLSGTSPAGYAPFVAAFREGLSEAGFVEGKNVAIEYRWEKGVSERLPAMAEDLVRRRVDLIVTSGSTLSAMAAKNATATIPTVFIAGDDPVTLGLVASLARPGGNRTGISFLVVDLNAKRFGQLCDLVPRAKRVGLMVNPRNPAAAERILHEITEAARQKGVLLAVSKSTSDAEIAAAIERFAQQHVDALMIGNDAFFNSRREQFTALTARFAIPASYESKESVRAGGLISYGPSFTSVYRRIGFYAGKILHGVKPADLPVEQPTRFELAVNLTTAKALGLEVPPIILVQADEVIE